MPLTDIGSYPVVMADFDDHWGLVNIELGGTPATDLKLEGDYPRASFTTLRNAIVASITGSASLENAREVAAQDRDTKKSALRDRLAQFRGIFRGFLSKSKYAAAVPTLPDFGAAESKFLAPFDDAADLWSRVNADTTIPSFTPPLVIGPYTRALFVTEIAGMRTAFGTLSTAENAQTIDIRERDVLLADARERMVQYRAMVEAVLGPNHPLTQSLPDLFPQPGSTPDPSTLSGGWNAALAAADFNWTASNHPDLVEYEIRMSPGATYNAATATVIGNVLPGTLTFQTTAGLASPGDTATFKVVVKLTSGNEAGSNTITITRP